MIKEKNIGKIQLVTLTNDFVLENFVGNLSDKERLRFESFQSEKRKKEYLGVIRLKNHLFEKEEILYEENGKPYLKHQKNTFISISHSYIYIGMVAGPFPVGLDIEKISPKVLRVTEKFINEEERKNFDLSSEEQMTRLWTIKEVLYKIISIVGFDYKDHIVVRYENGRYIGEVFIENKWYTTEIATFVKDNYVFSLNKTPLVPK